MDYTAHREALFAHYLDLIKQPGWRSYVEDQVAGLVAAHPDLYGDFPERLRAALPPKTPANTKPKRT